MNSSKVSPASCCFDEVMGCLVDYVKVEVEKERGEEWKVMKRMLLQLRSIEAIGGQDLSLVSFASELQLEWI